MYIRRAVESDSAAAVDIVRSVYDEYAFTWDEHDYHADLYDLRGFYLDPGHPFWLAEDSDGKPIGTVALEIFPRIPGGLGTLIEAGGQQRIAGCDCGLMRLYVRSEARRSGAGSALLSTVLAEARARDRRKMEIWSDKRFTDAHRLYERLGAVLAGDRICHDPDQSPEWGLFLKL